MFALLFYLFPLFVPYIRSYIFVVKNLRIIPFSKIKNFDLSVRREKKRRERR